MRDRDLANMRTFKGRAGESVSISGSVGDHILAGFIAVKEKGVKKWKPWKFNYAVGAPNAAISAADLQVLYINWNNKIRVSASGYKPEAIRLIGRGCNVKGPDSKGFYTATVTNVRAKEAKLIVTAIDDKGKSVELANEKFRIFPLPKPTAYFAGKAGGNLKKANSELERALRISKNESSVFLRLAHIRLEQGLNTESGSFAARGLLISDVSSWERLLLNVYAKDK